MKIKNIRDIFFRAMMLLQMDPFFESFQLFDEERVGIEGRVLPENSLCFRVGYFYQLHIGEIFHRDIRESALADAEETSRSAEFQIFFRDFEAIIGFFEDFQAGIFR